MRTYDFARLSQFENNSCLTERLTVLQGGKNPLVCLTSARPPWNTTANAAIQASHSRLRFSLAIRKCVLRGLTAPPALPQAAASGPTNTPPRLTGLTTNSTRPLDKTHWISLIRTPEKSFGDSDYRPETPLSTDPTSLSRQTQPPNSAAKFSRQIQPPNSRPPAQITSPKSTPSPLICRRLLRMIDHQHLHRSLHRLNLQPKLLIERPIQRRCRVHVVGGPVTVPSAFVRQHKIVFAC